MKQTAVVAAAVLVGLLLWPGSRFVPNLQDSSSLDQAIDQRPNIVFILTDDMKASDLDYMPNTQNLLANQGVKFTEAWVTRALCCPSRATSSGANTPTTTRCGATCLPLVASGGSTIGALRTPR